jgi:repressor LexA
MITSNTPPTEKQNEVLVFIRERIGSAGYPPTLKEIAEGLKYPSSNSVRCHLDGLRKRGLIEIEPGKARAIRVLESTNSDG